MPWGHMGLTAASMAFHGRRMLLLQSLEPRAAREPPNMEILPGLHGSV